MRIGIGNMRLMVLRFRSRNAKPMNSERERELWACDAGMFRIIKGQRCFLDPSQSTLERLQLDAVADTKARLQKTWRRG